MNTSVRRRSIDDNVTVSRDEATAADAGKIFQRTWDSARGPFRSRESPTEREELPFFPALPRSTRTPARGPRPGRNLGFVVVASSALRPERKDFQGAEALRVDGAFIRRGAHVDRTQLSLS